MIWRRSCSLILFSLILIIKKEFLLNRNFFFTNDVVIFVLIIFESTNVVIFVLIIFEKISFRQFIFLSFFHLFVVSDKMSSNTIIDDIYDSSSFQCIASINHELDQMINEINVFAFAFYFEDQFVIITSFCRQKSNELFNISSSCEKETLFLSHEENTMNTMNTIISFAHVNNTKNSSSIVEDTMISSFLSREKESIISSLIDDEFDANVLNEIALFNFSFTQIRTIKKTSISLFREKESIIPSFIDDEFDADVLNEIALFNFSFTQIRTARKTSITSVSKNKFNKKINDKCKKITKKLLTDNKNKKYFVERRFWIVF
jgi:hypothetical protein